jgi:hypothetical protein
MVFMLRPDSRATFTKLMPRPAPDLEEGSCDAGLEARRRRGKAGPRRLPEEEPTLIGSTTGETYGPRRTKCLTPQWSTELESALYSIEKFSQLQFKTRLLNQACHVTDPVGTSPARLRACYYAAV